MTPPGYLRSVVATPAMLPRNNPPKRAGGDSYEEFHPYGTTAWISTAGVTVSLKRHRFTGMERDEETGLQCHGVRYYAPWLGRWTSADPIGLGDGVNRFGYCHGGPVAWLDVRGTEVWATVTGVLQVVGGGVELLEASAIAGGTVGLAAVPAVLLAAHGLDTMYAGCKTLSTGTVHDTATADAVTSLATGVLSQSDAEFAGDAVDVVVGVVLTGPIRGGGAGATRLAPVVGPANVQAGLAVSGSGAKGAKVLLSGADNLTGAVSPTSGSKAAETATVGTEVVPASKVATGKWGAGSFDDAASSPASHFKKRRVEVGAKDAAQYLRKAEEFARTRRGATSFPVEGATEGVTRHVKNGRYVDLAPDGSIISFGASPSVRSEK